MLVWTLARIRLDNVHKAYGGSVALHATTLDVSEGEFLTLLGPSGCGKTTTLRILAGFVRPSGGRVWFGDKDVTDLPPQQRNVGVVFQDYALFPHLTVAQNIGFGLKARGARPKAIAQRVAELLDLIQLQDLARRRPGELSGGQQQRVALARAIAHPPSILLMDEPFAALDRQLRESLQVELRRIQRTLGVTTLFVTHDHGEALGLSDRIAVMDAGRIEQIDTPQAIFQNPKSRFTASFLGQVNLLPGAAAVQDGQVAWIDSPAGRIGAQAKDIEGPIYLGVRPDHLTIAGEADADPSRNVVRGRMGSRIFLGGHQKLIVWIGEIQWSILVDSSYPAPTEGEDIGLAWDVADTLVLKA